ncbi:MAG TPA: glycosyltransferase family 2 protein [Hyphomicrobium sp.]|nr:glycosyltransferase family 2 protein [Hyphomicrobium sp.]
MAHGARQTSDPADLAQPVSESRPFVTIVMPALNEQDYIAAAIDSVLPDETEVEYELLVMDGGSNDNTATIVRNLSASNSRIKLVVNEKRIQSCAVNKAARIADPRSKYLVRADCHAVYPANFVQSCAAALRDTNAASVVVSMRTAGHTPLQQAIAAAQNSRLGNGAAAHRVSGRSRFVDHGHHAAFDRKIFLHLGGYDENFSVNEDAELDIRLIEKNLNIYLAAEAEITYFPRRTLTGLARQYFNFGSGRARTILKHRRMPKLRQLAPLVILVSCGAALMLAPLKPHVLAVPLTYALLCLVWGAGLAAKERAPHLVMAGAVAMVMHLSWAAGVLVFAIKTKLVTPGWSSQRRAKPSEYVRR